MSDESLGHLQNWCTDLNSTSQTPSSLRDHQRPPNSTELPPLTNFFKHLDAKLNLLKSVCEKYESQSREAHQLSKVIQKNLISLVPSEREQLFNLPHDMSVWDQKLSESAKGQSSMLKGSQRDKGEMFQKIQNERFSSNDFQGEANRQNFIGFDSKFSSNESYSVEKQSSNFGLKNDKKMIELYECQVFDLQLKLQQTKQNMIKMEAEWEKRLCEERDSSQTKIELLKEKFKNLLFERKTEQPSNNLLCFDEPKRHSPNRGPKDTYSPLKSDNDKVKSLSELLEESHKEIRWLKDRNSESERVIEALRKTIMRQAELNSQRENRVVSNAPQHLYSNSSPHHRPQNQVPRGNRPMSIAAPHSHVPRTAGSGNRPPPFRVSPRHKTEEFFDGESDRNWGRSGAQQPVMEVPDRSRSAPLPEHQIGSGGSGGQYGQHSPWGSQQMWDRQMQLPQREVGNVSSGILMSSFSGGMQSSFGGGGNLPHESAINQQSVPPLYPTYNSSSLRATLSSPHLNHAFTQGLKFGEGGGTGSVGLPPIIGRKQSSTLSRTNSGNALNFINEDVHEFQPGELDTTSSLLGGF